MITPHPSQRKNTEVFLSLEAKPGSHQDYATEMAQEIADRLNVPVALTFNELVIRLRPRKEGDF